MAKRQTTGLARHIPSKEVWLITYNHEYPDLGTGDWSHEYIEFAGPLTEEQTKDIPRQDTNDKLVALLTNRAPKVVREDDDPHHLYPTLALDDWQEVLVLTSYDLEADGLP